MKMTNRQEQILRHIVEYTEANGGYCPTEREICEHFKAKGIPMVATRADLNLLIHRFNLLGYHNERIVGRTYCSLTDTAKSQTA